MKHPNAMPHAEVIAEAERLLAEHADKVARPVQVRMNPRLQKVYGRVKWTFPTWTLEMSTKLVDANDREQTLDTIRHEVAHVLAGPRAKHGPTWKAMCAITGARPVRCYSGGEVNAVDVAWRAECGDCGKEIATWTRKPKLSVRYHKASQCTTSLRTPITYIEEATGRRVTPEQVQPKLREPLSLGDLLGVPATAKTVNGAKVWDVPVDTPDPETLVLHTDVCKHGHVMDEANTYTDPRGSKVCRQCKRDAAARHKAKKEAKRNG